MKYSKLIKKYMIVAALLIVPLAASAQIDAIGLRTQLPQWVVLSPGAGLDVSWNGRYMAAAWGSYGDWNIPRDTKTARVSTAGLDMRRYFSDGTPGVINPNGGQYFGLYLGVAGRMLNFDQRLTSDHSQGNIWTVGPMLGYTFHMRGNWTCDASFGIGYIYDDYNRYRWYPPENIYRELHKVKGGRFGLTDLSVAITYRFKL